MKKYFGERIEEFAICLTIFFISCLCFGLVTDDYFYFSSAAAARQFGDFIYVDFHFQGFIGIREVYRLLYFLLPSINWYFVFQLLFNFTSLYLVLRTLKTIVLKNTGNVWLIRFIQILFALFFIENIIFISHTRASLIFCGIALFNLAFRKTTGRKEFFLNVLLFAFGLLLRPESGIGTFMLVAMGFLIYSLDIREMIKRLWLPALGIVVFITIFTIDWTYTDIYARKVEPEIEYKMMARRVVDIREMKTAKDSVKYEAAIAGMWFDMKEMTPLFMRSILLPGMDLSPEHALEIAVHVMHFYSYYIFVICVVICLVVLSVLMLPDYRIRLVKILLFQLGSWLLIYALDYNGFLVSNRHFLSFQIISLLVTCYFLFDAPLFKKTKYRSALNYILSFVLISGLGLTVINYNRELGVQNEQINFMRKTMKVFEQKYHNRIVAITIDNRFLMDQQLSLTNHIYTGNTYLMFDWFTFSLTPRYIDYLSRTCHCDAEDPTALFQWMAANNVLYLSAPHRYELTERYMRLVHGCKIKFTSPVKVNSLTGTINTDPEAMEIRTVGLAAE